MDKLKDMRIQPLPHQDWTPDIRNILGIFSQQLANLGSNGNEREKDNLSPVLSCLLQHPELAKVFLPLGRYLMLESTLDNRCRELIILQVTWRWRFEYEWAHHSMAAVNSGLFTAAELAQLQNNDVSTAWPQRERLLLQAVNELHDTSTISASTWHALTEHFNQQQMLDILFTVGGYVLSGFYMNAIALPLKDGMKGFPLNQNLPRNAP